MVDDRSSLEDAEMASCRATVANNAITNGTNILHPRALVTIVTNAKMSERAAGSRLCRKLRPIQTESSDRVAASDVSIARRT